MTEPTSAFPFTSEHDPVQVDVLKSGQLPGVVRLGLPVIFGGSPSASVVVARSEVASPIDTTPALALSAFLAAAALYSTGSGASRRATTVHAGTAFPLASFGVGASLAHDVPPFSTTSSIP